PVPRHAGRDGRRGGGHPPAHAQPAAGVGLRQGARPHARAHARRARAGGRPRARRGGGPRPGSPQPPRPPPPPPPARPPARGRLAILALLGRLAGPTRVVAKQSLWRHAVVGAVLDSLGMVPIDRESSADAVAVLNRVRDEGQSFVVFPEGTRSRDGRLGEFKKGAFVLAIRLGLPVVPVVCRGTRRLMPRGSRLTVIPGEVELVVERPIPTAGLRFEDRDDLAGRVREAILRHHTGW